MNEATCPREEHVARAAGSGQWTSALTAHIAECPDCADVALVSGLMRASEEPRDPQVDLSSAQRIWRRAEIEKQRTAAHKALLPVAVGELAACLFGAIALVVFAATHALPLARDFEATGAQLLANPLVMLVGTVGVGLTVSAGLLSIVLILGFRSAKT